MAGLFAAVAPTMLAEPVLSTITSLADWFPGAPYSVDHRNTGAAPLGKRNLDTHTMLVSTGANASAATLRRSPEYVQPATVTDVGSAGSMATPIPRPSLYWAPPKHVEYLRSAAAPSSFRRAR